VFVVDDLRAQLFAAGLGHGIFSDLVYYVVGIGLVEESVTWVPVGLVHRFTRHINEPVDWGIYTTRLDRDEVRTLRTRVALVCLSGV
jgi:hypothetical protein